MDSFGDFVTSAGHFDRFFSHDSMSGSLIFSCFSLHTLVRHLQALSFFPTFAMRGELQASALRRWWLRPPVNSLCQQCSRLVCPTPCAWPRDPCPAVSRCTAVARATPRYADSSRASAIPYPLADKGTCKSRHARSLCIVTRCLRQYRSASLATPCASNVCENPRCIFCEKIPKNRKFRRGNHATSSCHAPARTCGPCACC